MNAMKLSKRQTWMNALEPSLERFLCSGMQSDIPLGSNLPESGNILSGPDSIPQD